MKRATISAAALVAAVSLSPSASTAQDCADAIATVEQGLQQVQRRGDWNRAQVQLYLAEQFRQEGQAENCLAHVRRARAIVGAEIEMPAGVTASDAARAVGRGERETEETEDGPGGANIAGVDREGWGQNEAEGDEVPQEPGNLVGKTVQSPSGETLGTIADVLDETDRRRRFVIATGDKKVAVPEDLIRYDEANDVVVAEMTRQELADALALKGGVELGTGAGGGAGGSADTSGSSAGTGGP